MSNLQIIEALCNLVEKQSMLICRLASELEQMRCLSDDDHVAVEAAKKEYSAILGADEVPDNFI